MSASEKLVVHPFESVVVYKRGVFDRPTAIDCEDDRQATDLQGPPFESGRIQFDWTEACDADNP